MTHIYILKEGGHAKNFSFKISLLNSTGYVVLVAKKIIFRRRFHGEKCC